MKTLLSRFLALTICHLSTADSIGNQSVVQIAGVLNDPQVATTLGDWQVEGIRFDFRDKYDRSFYTIETAQCSLVARVLIRRYDGKAKVKIVKQDGQCN